MKAFSVVNGRVEEISHENISRKGTVWIRSTSPSGEELNLLQELSGIPLEEFQESIEEEERPRLSKKKYLEIIYDAPHVYRGEGLQTLELYFYVAGNLVITIEDEPNTIMNRIEAKIRDQTFMFRSQGAFLFHVLDEINDEFLLRIDRVARRLDAIGKKELTDVTTLQEASSALAYFNQAVIANLEVLSQLRKTHHAAFTAEDRRNFNELYVDKLQILDTEKIQRELIMHLINIQSIRSSERLNRTMKRLTVFALLIAIPTLMTSMYGMNVPLPFQEHEYAFAFIAFGSISLSILLLWIMHRLEWV